MDTLPRDGAAAPDEPHWRLPSPLQQEGGGLPVAASAPRIPRALRAFNGMPPAPSEPPPVADPPPSRTRPREPQRSLRDLLLDADAGAEAEQPGLVAGLRAAWRRMRHPEDEA